AYCCRQLADRLCWGSALRVGCLDACRFELPRHATACRIKPRHSCAAGHGICPAKVALALATNSLEASCPCPRTLFSLVLLPPSALPPSPSAIATTARAGQYSVLRRPSLPPRRRAPFPRSRCPRP